MKYETKWKKQNRINNVGSHDQYLFLTGELNTLKSFTPRYSEWVYLAQRTKCIERVLFVRRSCFYQQGNFFILYGGYGSHRFTLSLGPDRCVLLSFSLILDMYSSLSGYFALWWSWFLQSTANFLPNLCFIKESFIHSLSLLWQATFTLGFAMQEW